MRQLLNSTPLAPPSLVGELSTFECTIALQTPCRQVYGMLTSNALIPGVIVLDVHGDICGLMSRHRFMEVFSQSYRSEVYFSRPLEKLLKEEFPPPLCVAADHAIAIAADAALQRPRERFNEPLAVDYGAKQFRVLEIRDLLHALANIHAHQYAQLQVALDSLVQAEKLASLGGLVAGVAHEINTPIGVSLSAASHLVDQVDSFARLVERQQVRKTDLQTFVSGTREAAGIILNNMERAAGLVRSFKQVAADQTSESRRTFDLKQTVGEILFNLGPSFKHSAIELSSHVAEEITMDSYPGALAQIVSNLVLNAMVHGFQEGEAGIIQVTADLLPSHQAVQLRVQDDGRGIPADVLGRVFDPFFTTRRNQGGTGLGLHIVYNLVRNTLGGTISVNSTHGQGTGVVIQIPCITPATAAS